MYQDFPSDVICLKLLKNFVGEPFRASLVSVPKKFMNKMGVSRFFVENFLSHSAEITVGGIL